MSKIPDNVVFGPNEFGNPITYGFIRSITNEDELIKYLRLRLDGFFINQVQPLQISRCAFPLTTMTCIGIETLGEIFITPKNGDKSFQFIEIIKKTNQIFGRKPNKKYTKKLTEIWSEKDLKNIDNYGKLVYRFFRNTMIHGYQAKGMFLSYENTNSIEIDDELAFLKVNPDWFWNSFKVFFNQKFDEVIKSEKNDTERNNCLKYIQEYLLE